MKQTLLILIMLLSSLAVSAQTTTPQAGSFPMITIPEGITDPKARANYLGEHYWDNVNFANLSDEMLEQGFVDMVSIFSLLESEAVSTSWRALVVKSDAVKGGVARVLAMGEKYLFANSSPMHDEGAYRLLLQEALLAKKLTKLEKLPYQEQLVMLEMNNVGSAAVDFEYTLSDGTKSRLSELNAQVTVLFFYSPDCIDCKLQRFRFQQARMINYLERAGGLKVLAIYPENNVEAWKKYSSELPASWVNGYDHTGKIKGENLYDLRVTPRIYLLDAQKKVLLKNTKAEIIEQYLVDLMQSAAAQAQSASKPAAEAATPAAK